MNTRETEELTGISRQNIRYYERMGLLAPERDKGNAYRNYSEKDIHTLKLIKMLRMLDVPVEEIRKVIAGELSLSEVAEKQQKILNTRQKQLQEAAEICGKLKREKSKVIPVDAYLQEMEELERKGGRFAKFLDDYRKVAESEEEKAFYFYGDENEDELKLEVPEKRRKIFQGIHIVFRNICRQKKKSLLNILVCMLIVCFAAFYLGTIESHENQLKDLKDIYKIQGEIWNYRGTLNSGLKINTKYAEAVRRNSNVTDYQEEHEITAMVIGRNKGEILGVFANLNGINSIAAGGVKEKDIQWKDGMNGEMFLKSGSVCVVDETVLTNAGLELGDWITLDVSYYKETPDGTSLEMIPLCKKELQIVGCGSLADTDILCPLLEVKEWYEQAGVEYLPSRISFALKDPLKLNAFKKDMEEAGFIEVTQSVAMEGMYKGCALILDDMDFTNAAKSIQKSIRFLTGFYPSILFLMMITGYMVSFLLLQNRKLELALMRVLGTGRRRMSWQLFAEHMLTAAAGCMIAVVIAGVMQMGSGMVLVKVTGLFLLCYGVGTWISLWMVRRFSLISILMGKE